MSILFIVVMQIQMDVIKNFGFPGNREGLVQFEQVCSFFPQIVVVYFNRFKFILQLIREMERDDIEIARLRAQIRAIYLPPIAINPSNDILI